VSPPAGTPARGAGEERPPGGEETRRYWNERHANAIFSDEPAPWLVEHRQLIETQPRGRALDIACGGGRNALFLAELGFEVDALDISDVAIEHVRRLAAGRGLPIAAARADLAVTRDFPRPSYQIVIDFFYRERALFGPIADALAPAGLLFFQTFVGSRPDGAFGPRFGLEPGELRAAFARLEILHYDEVEIGDAERGRRTVARLAARG
jgi:tellurite methyltransferase